MKLSLFFLLGFAFFLSSNDSIAQQPTSMTYQTVIKENGNPIGTRYVRLRISIRQGTSAGTVVYREIQDMITGRGGWVNLSIGEGTVETGDFSTIDWEDGPYFVQIETDTYGGTNYTEDETRQWISGPHALYSVAAGQVLGSGGGGGGSIEIESVSSSDTLLVNDNVNYQDMPGVSLNLDANSVYLLKGSYEDRRIGGTNRYDVKFDYSGTTDYFFFSSLANILNSGSEKLEIIITNLSFDLRGINGIIITNNAGTLKLQFRRNSGSGSDTAINNTVRLYAIKLGSN